MIDGNDGGVYISTDAGKNWRYLDNIPIEQFYMVATDDNGPYLLCGGLQDNNGWCGPSNSLTRGGIVGADWWTSRAATASTWCRRGTSRTLFMPIRRMDTSRAST